MNVITKKQTWIIGGIALFAMLLSVDIALATEWVQGGAAHSQVYHDWWGRKKTKRTVAASNQVIYVDRNETIYVKLLASYGDSSFIHGARHELFLEVFENGRRLGFPCAAYYGGYTGGWERGSWWSQPRVKFSLSSRGWHYLDVKIRAKTDRSTKTRWGTISVYVR